MIGWALRIILLLIVLRLILRFVMGLFQGLAPEGSSQHWPQSSPQGARNAPRGRGPVALVRDPVCGTHIPRDRAITSGSGDHMLFFCSDECRRAYRAS